MPKRSPVLRPGCTDHAIHPLIAGRWSSRAIDPHRPVAADTVRHLLEAARWAPSAFNNQSWRYLVVTEDDPEALSQARATLNAGNAWALAAPALIFALARTHHRYKNRRNRHHLFELGMSTALMALQAANEGLVFHQMAGYDRKALRETFAIGDGYALMTAIAIGYPGDVDRLNEDDREGETKARTRKPQTEWVHWNRWVEDE